MTYCSSCRWPLVICVHLYIIVTMITSKMQCICMVFKHRVLCFSWHPQHKLLLYNSQIAYVVYIEAAEDILCL